MKLQKKISHIDAIISILYYIYYMIAIYMFGLVIFKTLIYIDLSIYFDNQRFFRFLFYIPHTIIILLPIFIILKLRKQSITTIGIRRGKILKSIFVGLIGSIPLAALGTIGPILNGKVLNINIWDNIWTFLYYLICISFTEELAFRGFLLSRIQELIKTKWISIIVVGIMFGLIHVPFQMIKEKMSIIDFILYDLSHLIITCIMHIYLVFLYNRDKNIIAPTIAHAIMNFSAALFI